AGRGGPIHVLLTDGRTLDAEVVNRNPTLDLALLKVPETQLPAALVGDSSRLRIGELVFAVGHPWGQRGVVTAGIVSGLGSVRPPGGEQSAQYIRSDVRLAPGNSGGPLLNAAGEVIGINAMIFGGDLGVAIPSHVATTWVAGLPSRRAVLGVGVRPAQLRQVPRDGIWAGRTAGLLVAEVKAGGPADRAGLLRGDVLLDVDGRPVADPDALLDALAAGAANDAVRLHALRRGAVLTVDVSLAPLEPGA
ncbi:MAG TPA: trypsin-like peptidase domain-containing protein, partial [Chloroflexia bacterium]|nr:trypsin-like peptidase domain-containing protein [Chloroflexia bacterium]